MAVTRLPITSRRRTALAAALAAAGIAGSAGTGLAAASAHPAGAVRYRYRTVTVRGKARSELNGINARGGYAGEGLSRGFTAIRLFVASPSGQRTFYRLPFRSLDTKAAFYESASGLDNAGDVAGTWTGTGGRNHGYLRRAGGSIAAINDPSASEAKNAGTLVEGISADGTVIVGAYYDRKLSLHGFLRRGGRYLTVDVPGAAGTELTFDDRGTYGGYYLSARGAMFGFYVRDGRLHPVAAPGEAHPAAGFGTDLVGISAAGTLFGDVFPAGQPVSGFSLARGRFTAISDPGQVGTTDLDGTAVTSVSSTGVAAGGYSYTPGTAKAGGLVRGFIATPGS